MREIHGFTRNSVIVPEGLDLTAPVADDPFGSASAI
jgi:hypothetical protein